jgi:hypothetical protein
LKEYRKAKESISTQGDEKFGSQAPEDKKNQDM